MSTFMDAPAPGLLRVMTLNVHKGFTFFSRRFMLRELRDAVREVGADLVFLQEIHGTRRNATGAAEVMQEVSHYEFLADQIWPTFAYGRNAVYSNGDHGNALLSKYPIVRCENFDVSAQTHEKRGLLHCALRLPGHDDIVHAVCVHLGLKQAHRTRQLQQLCEFVERRIPQAEPLLVAGDFNDWRGKAHAVLLQCAGLDEVFVEAHGNAARTYPARLPLLPLDRIYVRSVRDHMPLALPARPWSGLSDHAPLAAEIHL
jgi:endonuclease/exonuclease/phosphatase family metal-dependent hydrolase